MPNYVDQSVPINGYGNVPINVYWNNQSEVTQFFLHAIYFLFQKVDVAANTMAAAASESEQLVTAGHHICFAV